MIKNLTQLKISNEYKFSRFTDEITTRHRCSADFRLCIPNCCEDNKGVLIFFQIKLSKYLFFILFTNI